MGYGKLALTAAFAISAGLAGVRVAAAETTVRMLHVEQNAAVVEYWNDIARRYEATHPGVKVDVQYLENEAYKKKLTTLLQSADKPNIIYSWGGGVMRAQVKAGVHRGPDARSWTPPGRIVSSLARSTPTRCDGKLVRRPLQLRRSASSTTRTSSPRPASTRMRSRPGTTSSPAVKKLKAAGITPIVMGGGDKWPMHFYWSYLAMRIGGADAFETAEAARDRLRRARPSSRPARTAQGACRPRALPGRLARHAVPASAGQFGDGKGAIDADANWLLGTQKANSADKQGHSRATRSASSPSRRSPAARASRPTRSAVIGWLLITKGSPPGSRSTS